MTYSNFSNRLRNIYYRYTPYLYPFLIAFTLILLSLPKNVFSLDITLAWDFPEEEKAQISGYRIFYRREGENYNYNEQFEQVEDPNIQICTIYNLDNNIIYCFVARAIDYSDNQSPNSNEVCYNPEINSPPVAHNQSITTAEDTLKAITLMASDADLDPLTYTLLTQPAHGTLSGTAPNLTYSPYANYNGPDSFTFKVNDGTADSNTATVSITITPVNDPPVANARTLSTNEDTATSQMLSASDPDGDGLVYSIVTNGSKGTAVITNSSTGAFTYTPNNDMNGTDTFGFKVNDGAVDSAPATVTVTIAPVNDAPVANSQSVGTNENMPLGIILTGSDVDGDVLSYVIFTQPAHGTLSGTAPNLTYSPHANFNGPDSFTFKVNDGNLNSNIAMVNIMVSATDDPPEACAIYEDSEDGNIDGWVIYDQDPSGASIINVFDMDRQSRVIELIGISREYLYLLQDVDGNKWHNSSQFISEWSMRYSGYFIIYFDVHTTAGNKYIYYSPVDDDYLGTGYYVHHGLGSWVTDGQWHSFERDLQADLEEAQPGVHILEVNGMMIYGSGKVDDIKLCNAHDTDPNENPVNSPPVAENQSITTAEDTLKAITLIASDADLDPLTYVILTQPVHGTLSGTAPNLTYSPYANYNGTDSFTFKVNDGTADSNTATVSITITPVNDPPVANARTLSTNEDMATSQTLSASDPDGDGLVYSIVTNGSKGTAVITNPSTGAFTYTPNNDMNGTDTFGFKVNDGAADSAPATVTVTIAPVNDAPVANSQSVGTDENTPLGIILTGSDGDGDALSYVILTQPAYGTLSGTAPNLNYSPDTNYSGSDSFSFKVNDGIADSNIATVNLIIYPINDPPSDCQVYEDAEDGHIDGWIIYDQDPSGGSIINIFDNERQSRVIELISNVSREYIYLLQNPDGSKWHNSTQFVAQWSMQYTEYFIIYFNVETTVGQRYIYYTPVDSNNLGYGWYIHHGLGSGIINGQWYTFERDLQADLEDAQPGASILEVNDIMIYGSGRVDDIELCNMLQD